MNLILPPTSLLAIAALSVLVLVLMAFRARSQPQQKPLPTEWALTGRPVFSTDERRVYRLLREALPHHVILSKLPLVRFCQPTDPRQTRYWYDLLGGNHVTYAVCSANGRVLAAIDLDSERGSSQRAQAIKQAVLSACRVRYLHCRAENLPSIAELQLLVPHSGAAARAPEPMPMPLPPTGNINEARSSLANAVANRRAERSALWKDSQQFQDSFFALDSRLDGMSSDFNGLSERPSSLISGAQTAVQRPAPPATTNDDAAGIVIDANHPGSTSSLRH